MHLLIRLKMIALIMIWSLVCLGLYGIVALAEAVLEIGVGAAGSMVGQGGNASGLIDLTGDIIQWGIGLIWIVGAGALWFLKRLITSRETRAATLGVATKVAGKAVPYVIDRHPLGRVVNTARGPAGKLLGNMLLSRRKKPETLK